MKHPHFLCSFFIVYTGGLVEPMQRNCVALQTAIPSKTGVNGLISFIITQVKAVL